MSQKPTVGRQVHFYGKDTHWHGNIAASIASAAEKEQVATYDGPFAATVVLVKPNGKVNLLICHPSPCYGSREKTEVVENVPFSDEPRADYWSWPPRV